MNQPLTLVLIEPVINKNVIEHVLYFFAIFLKSFMILSLKAKKYLKWRCAINYKSNGYFYSIVQNAIS